MSTQNTGSASPADNTRSEAMRLAYKLAAVAVEDAADNLMDNIELLDNDDEYNFIAWNQDEIGVALRSISDALAAKARAIA